MKYGDEVWEDWGNPDRSLGGLCVFCMNNFCLAKLLNVIFLIKMTPVKGAHRQKYKLFVDGYHKLCGYSISIGLEL